MHNKELQDELNSLRNVFSKNEERISQLKHREYFLKNRLNEVAAH